MVSLSVIFESRQGLQQFKCFIGYNDENKKNSRDTDSEGSGKRNAKSKPARQALQTTIVQALDASST